MYKHFHMEIIFHFLSIFQYLTYIKILKVKIITIMSLDNLNGWSISTTELFSHSPISNSIFPGPVTPAARGRICRSNLYFFPAVCVDTARTDLFLWGGGRVVGWWWPEYGLARIIPLGPISVSQAFFRVPRGAVKIVSHIPCPRFVHMSG